MAKCSCGREMLRAFGCRYKRIVIGAAGEEKSYERIKMGAPGDFYAEYVGTPDEKKIRCGDCGAKIGHYHHTNCDLESCPICSGQLLSCDCFDSEGSVFWAV